MSTTHAPFCQSVLHLRRELELVRESIGVYAELRQRLQRRVGAGVAEALDANRRTLSFLRARELALLGELRHQSAELR